MNLNKTILSNYGNSILKLLETCELHDKNKNKLDLDQTFKDILSLVKNNKNSNQTIFFVGNGGSNAISSHMAVDWTKNGGMRSYSLDNSSLITCISNDYGYEYVYSKQIEFYAKSNDVLFAISSGGNSKNIINAVIEAKKIGLHVITLSGFEKNNFLRYTGDINFYISSKSYGFVEIGHEMILHSLLDYSMGLLS